MTGDDLLAAAAGELYSADPEDFTRRRAELAAGARAAGQSAVARQIAGLRKPTRSAWMINKLVRSDPDAVTRLAVLGEDLRAAERAGDGSRMRELSRARRQLIANLVPRALAVSGQHPPPAALREEITATFSAALADPEVAEQIRHATLLRAARRAGFGTAQAPALALVPPLPEPAQDGGRKRKPARAGRAPGRPGASPSAGTTQADSERDRRRARAKAEPARASAGRGRRSGAEGDRRFRAEAETDRFRAKAETEQARAEAETEQARAEAETERARAEAETERARAEAEAERARRRARAEAEQALAAAEQAAQAARQAQQEQEEAVRRLEQQLIDVRRRLHGASAQARQAEIARRRARQALGRLPE